MLVQFLTDDIAVQRGFLAYFHYIPIEPNCVNWLNMTAQVLKSPDYPIIDCSWVITAPSRGSNCTIHFETFKVKCIWFHFFDTFILPKVFSLGILIQNWKYIMEEVIKTHWYFLQMEILYRTMYQLWEIIFLSFLLLMAVQWVKDSLQKLHLVLELIAKSLYNIILAT